jgi:thioredoxin 1
MNATTLIGIVIAVVALAGVGFYVLFPGQGEQAMETDSMMEKSGEEMMEKDNAMMDKGDVMEKTDDAMMEKEGEMMEGDMMMKQGSYEQYSSEKIALAKEGDLVLFFRASWCPTCRALDADIKAHLTDIPQGVTILDVNYDTETALKQKYGVTYQHTLVQVDASGNQITKWSGSSTLTDLLAKVK